MTTASRNTVTFCPVKGGVQNLESNVISIININAELNTYFKMHLCCVLVSSNSFISM